MSHPVFPTTPEAQLAVVQRGFGRNMTRSDVIVLQQYYGLTANAMGRLVGAHHTTVHRWLDERHPARPTGPHARLLWLLSMDTPMRLDQFHLWDLVEKVDHLTNPYYTDHPNADPVSIPRDNPLYDFPVNVPKYKYTVPVHDLLFIQHSLLRLSGVKLARLLDVTQPTFSRWTTAKSTASGAQAKLLYLLAQAPYITPIGPKAALEEMARIDLDIYPT